MSVSAGPDGVGVGVSAAVAALPPVPEVSATVPLSGNSLSSAGGVALAPIG